MKLVDYVFPVTIHTDDPSNPAVATCTAAELARDNEFDPEILAGLRMLRIGAAPHFYIGGGASVMFCVKRVTVPFERCHTLNEDLGFRCTLARKHAGVCCLGAL